MNKVLLIGFAMALAWLLLNDSIHGKTTQANATSTKRALIVAIGTYAPNSGWKAINSVNDVTIVKAALKQQGFKEANIRVITNAQATKKGIVLELQALASRAQANDVIVFHFSGHGQQIADNNGDEVDRLDEALVPYDAFIRPVPGKYIGNSHLRDEELGDNFNIIRERIGPKGEMLAILDACHSGTATRGLAIARGTNKVFSTTNVRAQVSTKGSGFIEVNNDPALAPLVCYSACSPHQLNFETLDKRGISVGSLSLAFSNALTRLTAVPTYETLFDHIKGEMAAAVPSQTPQVEGTTNGLVFQGKTVALPEHFKPISWTNERELVVQGGLLMGLYEGTSVALYPPDSAPASTLTPLATGRVASSNFTSATITLNRPLKGTAREVWVVIKAHNFGKLAITLKLDVASTSFKRLLVDSIQQHPFIKLANTGSIDLLIEQKKNVLQLITSYDDTIKLNGDITTNPVGVVQSTLEMATHMAQAKYIRSLHTRSQGLQVAVELVPITVKKQDQGLILDRVLPQSSKLDGSGGLVYKAGDYMQLKVTNTGIKRAYYTIIDIQPDNQMNVLVPIGDADEEHASTYILEPGKSILHDNIWQLAPPYGQELYKVIASTQPMDLRQLIKSRGKDRARGPEGENPFAVLLESVYKSSGVRGTINRTLPAEEVTISDIIFRLTL